LHNKHFGVCTSHSEQGARGGARSATAGYEFSSLAAIDAAMGTGEDAASMKADEDPDQALTDGQDQALTDGQDQALTDGQYQALTDGQEERVRRRKMVEKEANEVKEAKGGKGPTLACLAAAIPSLNNCARLRAFFGCVKGCGMGIGDMEGEEHPAFVSGHMNEAAGRCLVKDWAGSGEAIALEKGGAGQGRGGVSANTIDQSILAAAAAAKGDEGGVLAAAIAAAKTASTGDGNVGGIRAGAEEGEGGAALRALPLILPAPEGWFSCEGRHTDTQRLCACADAEAAGAYDQAMHAVWKAELDAAEEQMGRAEAQQAQQEASAAVSAAPGDGGDGGGGGVREAADGGAIDDALAMALAMQQVKDAAGTVEVAEVAVIPDGEGGFIVAPALEGDGDSEDGEVLSLAGDEDIFGLKALKAGRKLLEASCLLSDYSRRAHERL
jgi:hypothetical protein